MRKALVFLAFTVISVACLPGDAAIAQDFSRSYELGSGGSIRIRNISGDISVIGYSGSSVVVEAFKQGRDRDLVEIEDNSSDSSIDVGVKFPDSGNTNASVNFEVKVPDSDSYRFEGIATVSGDVEMENVNGRIKANSVSGDVDVVDVVGVVSASTVSGNVRVEINNLDGGGNMKFSSISGNVYVKAPNELDAVVEMSSVSGSVRTDFPIRVIKRRYGPGSSAKGTLGSGKWRLAISTVSGSVSLQKTDGNW